MQWFKNMNPFIEKSAENEEQQVAHPFDLVAVYCLW
jgi:hypothetical protein